MSTDPMPEPANDPATGGTVYGGKPLVDPGNPPPYTLPPDSGIRHGPDPIDLDAIEARMERYAATYGNAAAIDCADDVPALVAEVRRLRGELADADAELVRVRASLDSSYRRLDMLTADRDRQVAAGDVEVPDER